MYDLTLLGLLYSCLPLEALQLPRFVLNWIISFLTDRSQVPRLMVNVQCHTSRSNLQGSGIGPTLYIVMENDLHPVPGINLLIKYADDTNWFY